MEKADKQREYNKAYYAANKDKIKEHVKKKRIENPEKYAEYERARRKRDGVKRAERQRKYYRNNKQKCLEGNIKRKYGVTVEQYEQMIKKQNGLCAICGGPPVNGRENLDVDHCHETGRVRGLLCSHHNVALGLFGDDITLLEAAIGYLKANLG